MEQTKKYKVPDLTQDELDMIVTALEYVNSVGNLTPEEWRKRNALWHKLEYFKLQEAK